MLESSHMYFKPRVEPFHMSHLHCAPHLAHCISVFVNACVAQAHIFGRWVYSVAILCWLRFRIVVPRLCGIVSPHKQGHTNKTRGGGKGLQQTVLRYVYTSLSFPLHIYIYRYRERYMCIHIYYIFRKRCIRRLRVFVGGGGKSIELDSLLSVLRVSSLA